MNSSSVFFSAFESMKTSGRFLLKISVAFWILLAIAMFCYTLNSEIPLDPRYQILENLPECQLDQDRHEPFKYDLPHLMDQFQECIQPIVGKWKNDTLAINAKWEETERCDAVFAELDLTYFKNLDEKKWTMLPNCKEENVMVTLGIGHDTRAEEHLKRTLPNTTFYGADAIIDPNRELYSKFGKFFPFAIGRKPGFSTFFVLPKQKTGQRIYHYEEVTTIPFSYLLSDILGLKKIDMLWIDIEGGELQFLEQFHRGEELDKKGVSVCQLNLEVHSKYFPDLAGVFHDFVFRVLSERRFVFFKPHRTFPGVHRMFFINVENKECVRKFLQ